MCGSGGLTRVPDWLLLTGWQSSVIEPVASASVISAMTCWEIAKLVSLGRITLSLPVDEWLDRALAYPGVRLLDLTPRIAVESTRLPGDFHRDPADQII